MRILLVEDDADISAGLTGALTQAGYALDLVTDGASALAALDAQRYDLVLLDIGLPRLDGFEVLRAARAGRHTVPMLIMTARDALEDRVRGLNLGADDYLTKPFELAELEARVRALIRRSAGAVTPEILIGALTIDTITRTARYGGEIVKLSPRDFALLEILAMRSWYVVPKDRLVKSMSTWD